MLSRRFFDFFKSFFQFSVENKIPNAPEHGHSKIPSFYSPCLPPQKQDSPRPAGTPRSPKMRPFDDRLAAFRQGVAVKGLAQARHQQVQAARHAAAQIRLPEIQRVGQLRQCAAQIHARRLVNRQATAAVGGSKAVSALSRAGTPLLPPVCWANILSWLAIVEFKRHNTNISFI